MDVNEELMKAIVSEDVPLVKRLLDHPGIDPNFTDSSGGTPLNNACAFSMPTEVIQKLIDKGANPNAANKIGSTPLIHAVYAKCPVETVQALVDAGADVTYKNRAGGTPLIVACICNNSTEVIQALLAAGADPSARNSSGISSLMYAIRNNNPIETIYSLIEAGARLNDKSFRAAKYSEFTALHFAAGEGRKDVCALLIEKGADLKAVNSDGLTALQIANQDTQTAMKNASFKVFSASPAKTASMAGKPATTATTSVSVNPLLTREAKEGKIGVRSPAAASTQTESEQQQQQQQQYSQGSYDQQNQSGNSGQRVLYHQGSSEMI